MGYKKKSESIIRFLQNLQGAGRGTYEMDLLQAGEELYAAMKRSTNGGGENSPVLKGEDDLYELFFAQLPK